MTIRYRNGRTTEGCILSRSERTIRVSVKDHEGAIVLTRVNKTWVSDYREPVDVVFNWHRNERKKALTESDGICPKDLAARLLRVLLAGDKDECETKYSRDLFPRGQKVCHAAAQ